LSQREGATTYYLEFFANLPTLSPSFSVQSMDSLGHS
jgi:hypothetical protein